MCSSSAGKNAAVAAAVPMLPPAQKAQGLTAKLAERQLPKPVTAAKDTLLDGAKL